MGIRNQSRLRTLSFRHYGSPSQSSGYPDDLVYLPDTRSIASKLRAKKANTMNFR